MQHYLYCPHRWALLYEDMFWEENAFTVRGDIIHRNAHSGDICSTRGKISMSGVAVYSKKMGIYGKTDILELKPDKQGVIVEGYSGKYSISIIEYKPTEPKISQYLAERIQLYAQKICVDELFFTNSTAYFYYADTKKRVKVDFSEEILLLPKLVSEIATFRKNGIRPSISYAPRCDGCSMKSVCMPKCKHESVKESVLRDFL